MRHPATRAPAGELLATAVTLATLAEVSGSSTAPLPCPRARRGPPAHLLVTLMRRAGRGVALSAIVSLVGVAALQVVGALPADDHLRLPRRATFEAIGADLGGIWQFLRTSQVPLSEDTGLLVVAAAVAWLLALLSDWAAFRVGARGEALAPAVILLASWRPSGPAMARSSTPPSAWPAPCVRPGARHGAIGGPTRRRPRPAAPAARAPGNRDRRTGGRCRRAGHRRAGARTQRRAPEDAAGPVDPCGGQRPEGRSQPSRGGPGQLLQNPDLELFVVESSGRS